MRIAGSLLVGLLSWAGCSQSSPRGDVAGSSSSPGADPSPAAPAPAPSEERKLCLPVAACNMFVKCALVAEEPETQGAERYRVLHYDHHPNRVGERWSRDEVCWKDSEAAPAGCADALIYRAPCTPTPAEQMPLRHRCATEGDGCVVK